MRWILGLGVFGLFGCGGGEATCTSGELCECSGVNACSHECEEDGGCSFSATGIGAASFDCAGGGCDLTSTATGAASLECAGGGCTVTSSATGSVSLACAGGGCEATCTGAGSCAITDCPTCVCTGNAANVCTVE